MLKGGRGAGDVAQLKALASTSSTILPPKTNRDQNVLTSRHPTWPTAPLLLLVLQTASCLTPPGHLQISAGNKLRAQQCFADSPGWGRWTELLKKKGPRQGGDGERSPQGSRVLTLWPLRLRQAGGGGEGAPR